MQGPSGWSWCQKLSYLWVRLETKSLQATPPFSSAAGAWASANCGDDNRRSASTCPRHGVPYTRTPPACHLGIPSPTEPLFVRFYQLHSLLRSWSCKHRTSTSPPHDGGPGETANMDTLNVWKEPPHLTLDIGNWHAFPKDAINQIILNPDLAPLLAIVKAARNGAVYGAKVGSPGWPTDINSDSSRGV